MMRGNFASRGNFRGNFRGNQSGNFGGTQGGTFGGGNQGGNFGNRNQSGNFGRNQQSPRGNFTNTSGTGSVSGSVRPNQGNRSNQATRPNQVNNKNQPKSPVRNDPPKKISNTPIPAKPSKSEEVKPAKSETKQDNTPQLPVQPSAKKDTTPVQPTPPAKKAEAPKATSNGTPPPKTVQEQPPQKKTQPARSQPEERTEQPTRNQHQRSQSQRNQQRDHDQSSEERTSRTQDQGQERGQFNRQDRQNQKKQFNRGNRERDAAYSGYSKPDQSYGDAGGKEEKKFTGRCRLFIGNLTPDVSEDDFKKMFEQFGEVSEAYVNSGRGFGFIRMDYRHNAEAAKAALDGLQKKGRTLRVRFATHGAALKVRNIHQHASNELLENAFSQFGDLERAIVIVDDRGKPTGEGIVEFVRKPGAQQALRRINDGIFLLGSSPRPILVEPLEQTDEDDGMLEKFLNKNEAYKKEREKEPRFAMGGSFEFEFAQRWRQIDELEKERIERVKKEMEEARLRLDDEMQGALIEYQADQIRKDLMRQQEELRRLEDMRNQDQMRRRQEVEMRQREEERIRAVEERRLQELMMGRSMNDGGQRGRDDMMGGGMRDGSGPRGLKDGAPPMPPPPAPPAGMGLERSGRSGQMSGNYSSSSGMGGGGSSMGGSVSNQGGNMGGMGGGSMTRQSRFDQQGSFEGGFQQAGQGMGGPMGGSMGGGNLGSGPGSMFTNQGMGSGSNMGASNASMGMRGDRRREGPREEYGDVKRRRY